MEISNSNNLALTTEVTVANIDRDFVMLEIPKLKEQIFWPLKDIPENLRPNLKIGDKLNLELKPSQSAVQNIIDQAKKNINEEDQEAKRRLLEKLIN